MRKGWQQKINQKQFVYIWSSNKLTERFDYAYKLVYIIKMGKANAKVERDGEKCCSICVTQESKWYDRSKEFK